MSKSKQITTNRQTIMRVLAVALATVLVLAACGSSSDDSTEFNEVGGSNGGSASDTTAAAATTFAPTSDRESDDGAELGSGGLGQPAQQTINIARDIIFTAEMTVSVDNVADASDQAIAIITGFRGFLFGQRAVAEPEPTNVLVFKVPPDRFQEALAALGEVGDIRNQTVSADDVTERIVDLQSRISTSKTSVERLRTLLEGAETVKIITELENQLLERETSLEQMRGQLRTLEGQVSLATITIAITESVARPAVDVRPTAYLGFEDDGTSCPGDSGIRVVEGETITFCLEIVNVGDTSLTDIEVRDVVIGREMADFIIVFGDLSVPLEPGQSVVLATELEIERTLRSQTRVTATPLNEDGTLLEGRSVANTSTINLVSEDPGGIPGFSEGLSKSWDVLVNGLKLLILAIGALIPFIWVIPLVWLYLRWRRNKAAAAAAAREAARRRIPAPVPAPVTDQAEDSTDEPDADDAWDLEDDV
ncbi:MAG: DUF4349 domain-containing protein [bacterium]|nr:DUF4349 domain-containing protein [bacterium]